MNTSKCYLWAVKGSSIPVGEIVANRYQVVGPQIWQDTQPQSLPPIPDRSDPKVLAYLHLASYLLHLPQLYGSVEIPGHPLILLLDRIPITPDGTLYPSITEAWPQTPPVRQVYWLWQLSQLWNPLNAFRAGASLLTADNIRVQGWRIHLRELIFTSSPPNVAALSRCWQTWIEGCSSDIQERLSALCQEIEEGKRWDTISASLNQMLLELAAELPLKIKTSGGTDAGTVRSHNEDSCYPIAVSQNGNLTPEFDRIRELAIVCDGLDGHEGGEVASELAVRSVKLQVQGLLLELAEQTEVVEPTIWIDHMTSVIRIVNNLIATQNDMKGRSGRERMATTLVMALQIAQTVKTDFGLDFPNAHELYLAHVGDSRAYWITPDYCQLLTQDDDFAHWQVTKGECCHRQAAAQDNAMQLIQALGVQHADNHELVPHVQRLIIEEDGLLLLCSDGLSDRHTIEQYWQQEIHPIFAGQITLEKAVNRWLELGRSDQNPDNVSVVLMYCQVSPQEEREPSVLQSGTEPKSLSTGTINAELSLPESPEFVFQQVIPEPEAEPALAAPQPEKHPSKRVGAIVWGLLLLLLLGAGFGLWYSGLIEIPGLNAPQPRQED
ncbi:MAG: protein phosphatase 2C domain-containing protein [Roseofilum sp. SBFL]|uniref:PP2C family protein-serine/threonine phosphatase n=1 Tax=unclassified Roseofilum TaxID=2620099 RepID=UPI001B0417EC|nr:MULTISPECIES: protein phosphatase 2C domain-containing protein [unclassified Roseofilum]MBP0025556.1 protein phosphatase 2C domain-containing protein [Roseofilum sp. SID2]MBP0042813.1 protein phosphatase 2C domain-containing protein [Roseofilum sp. SBFL]